MIKINKSSKVMWPYLYYNHNFRGEYFLRETSNQDEIAKCLKLEYDEFLNKIVIYHAFKDRGVIWFDNEKYIKLCIKDVFISRLLFNK